MAATDNFCLRLNEFENNIQTSWKEFQLENDFCDVTLACDDKQIQAHKIIISSCSPVLRNILKQNHNSLPLIYLRRVRYKDLENLLSFMYQGQVNIAQEDLPGFLEVAEDLKIRGLSEGYKEGCISKQREPLQPPKKKRDEEKANMEGSNSDFVIDPFTEFQQKFEDSANSDIDNKRFDLTSSNKIENNVAKEKDMDYTYSNNQELISVDGGKNFSCELCDKQFSSSNVLKRHIRSVHEGESYQCNKCDYKATQNAHLKIHFESVHEGIRYPCDQCEFKGTRKAFLTKHIKSVHERN